MFVGYAGDGNGLPDENDNPDANCADAFAFAALVDIPANTTIFFTEAPYNGTSFDAVEGDVSWSNTEITPAGTIVNITTHEEFDGCEPITASVGTAQFATDGTGGWALSSSNQVLYAYLGTVRMPTVWLSGFITDNSTGFAQFPPELTGFVIDLTNVDQDADVAVLSSEVNCDTRAECLAFILDLNNWVTEDDIGFGACCDDDGIDYPEDLPSALEACVLPVINGVTIVDCSGGVSGLITLAVDGELNGANGWQWTDLNVNNFPCEGDQIPIAFSTPQVLGSYLDYLDHTFYVRAVGGCIDEPVCFAFVPSQLLGQPASISLPVTTYCEDAGIQAGLAGGSPASGVYSGPGVTDDGNGMTFSFDPAAAGVGSAIITYTYNTGTACGESTATTNITVAALPTVTFTAPGPFNADDEAVMLTQGMPAGGTYSGPGVTDSTFDPTTAGAGMHTITYSYTDANGCSASATGIITVEMMLPADNACAGANDISSLFGQGLNEPQTSGLFDNTGYNSSNDPSTGFECFDDGTLERTTWYTFTGDGNTYQIKTVECDATNYLTNGDTQIAIYSGDCTDLTAVACSEDEDFASEIYNANVELMTEAGVTYVVMIDGWTGANYSAEGEFCIEVTNLSPSAVTNIDDSEIEIYPNPTTGIFQLFNIEADRVEVFDNLGQSVFNQTKPGNSIDITHLPTGLYLMKISVGEELFSAKVVKE
ncbi:MAG: hypothetical protein DHS20C18_34070 [Saprospiraceae bacterium]|nr:MAG: hypothetical protein DHS20C18_34070 [Saprospiraceae bacterium]